MNTIKDVGFPYMMDDRHPRDTLFIFFESDFRWRPSDIASPAEWLSHCLKHKDASGKQEGASAGASRPAVATTAKAPPPMRPQDRPAGKAVLPGELKSTGRQPESYLGHEAGVQGTFQSVHAPVKPGGSFYSEVGHELVELVQTASQAHRLGKGEVIWFSYNCHSRKLKPYQAYPEFGSQGIMFTRTSAESLHAAMLEEAKGSHFDCWLLKQLTKAGASRPARSATSTDSVLAKACFVRPPAGGYCEHTSLNIKKGRKVREACWTHAWSCNGGSIADPINDQLQLRGLCRFGVSGIDRELDTVKCGWASAALHWRTEVPPSSTGLSDSSLWSALLQSGGVARNEVYYGPYYTYDEYKRWKAHEAAGTLEQYKPTPNDLLRDTPDEPFDKGPPGASRPGGACLSFLHRRFCNRSFEHAGEQAKWKPRFKRRYNQFARLHEMRFFVPYKSEQVQTTCFGCLLGFPA